MSPHRRRKFTSAQRCAVFLAVACLFASGARAENWINELYRGEDGFGAERNVNVKIGARLLDSKYWKPVDTQTELGVDADYDGGQWPIALCGSVLFSTASGSTAGVDVTARILEVQFGVRKIWRPLRWFRPYVGGGGSVLGISYSVDGVNTTVGSDRDSGLGLWAGGGAYLKLGPSWQVGVDARWSRVNVDVKGTEANAGGLQVGVTAGYHGSE